MKLKLLPLILTAGAIAKNQAPSLQTTLQIKRERVKIKFNIFIQAVSS
ncbi:hypothetical protein [Argonema galeatum]|nr:hypothetical protein [Argonema galeatum]MCL1462905.1 hypothetical protein [Argonema galeatum A003/A1]